MNTPRGSILGPVDFDLHGLVGIRLIDATQHEVQAVTNQLGPLRTTLTREPDITIRFQYRIASLGTEKLLGLDDAAYVDDQFLILRSKHKAPARVQIPLDQVGGPCEIICEYGLPAVPLLIAIINLTVLAKGALPLHAAAFNYQGQGILTTGWSKGGKTETLLAFTSHGAEYIGDEWIYLTTDGRMFGIPEELRVWDWHLDSLPHYQALAARKDRVRVQTLRTAISATKQLPSKYRQRVTPLLKEQLYVQMSPQRLFGQRITPMQGRFDQAVFVASHESQQVVVSQHDPIDLAQRMVFSLQEERMPLMSYYWKFRFAFPDRPNEFLERCQERERELITQIFADKPCYSLFHPYPVEIPRLFSALEPVLMGRTSV